MNIWDEDPDSESNLRFDKKKPGVVVGGTFNKLVERITSSKDHGECRVGNLDIPCCNGGLPFLISV